MGTGQEKEYSHSCGGPSNPMQSTHKQRLKRYEGELRFPPTGLSFHKPRIKMIRLVQLWWGADLFFHEFDEALTIPAV
jgi:hypothetical protein